MSRARRPLALGFGFALLACVANCRRPEAQLARADSGPPLAPLPAPDSPDGLESATPDVRHFVRAAMALRDSARHGNRDRLGDHPEVPWLQQHVAWNLLGAIAASHGLHEATLEVAQRSWPYALDDADHVAERPIDVADLAKSLGETIGTPPCTVGPLDEPARGFVRSYLTFEPLPSELDAAIDTRLVPYRQAAASVAPDVVVRCAHGLHAVAFGTVTANGTTRLVPIVIRTAR
jgi:hypothetical protein